MDMASRRGHCPALERDIFLDGTACCGKTTLLKKLPNKEYIFPVFNDFHEQVVKHPKHLFKHTVPEQGYHAHLYETLEFATKKDGIKVYDRSPFATFIYSHYFSGTPINWDEMPKECPLNIIIIIDSDVKSVCERMKKRNNGIDVLNEDYVKWQNKMFTLLAKKYDFNLIDLSFNGYDYIYEVVMYHIYG